MANQRIVFTHAFDFYYKWVPTSSFGIGSSGWPFETVSNSGASAVRAPEGYYNNGDAIAVINRSSATTRETASLQASGSAAALPWGSAAADYLWNCLVPTQSGFATTSVITFPNRHNKTTYTFTYNSASFLYNKGNLGSGDEQGKLTYPITSSWKAVEPYMTASRQMTYFTSRVGSIGSSYPADYFPATINANGVVVSPTPGDGGYALPSARNKTLPAFQEVSAVNSFEPSPPGTNPDMITYGDKSTGSFDSRFFDLAGGIGISRHDVSASLAGYDSQSNSQTSAVRKNLSNELKRRRLFFPTVSTGSGAPDLFWLGYESSNFGPGGIASDTIFNENGGIYNVKFNIKRNLEIDMYPDEGGGSELLVYIFDVKPNVGLISTRVAGTAGFYPPDNNIIRIQNNSPAMSFINPATGFLLETFNINVVQYGSVAQLVFEASGSLSNDKYFGCIIDDVEFCKVGVSTDPALLKPETIGDTIASQADPNRSV